MKKIIFIALFAFAATSMNAQFYTGLSFGYGLGANKTDLGTEISNDGSQTQLYGSFGEGINITGKFGYMFNDYLGLELGANYFMGATQILYTAPGTLVDGTSNAIILLPQFVLKTESGVYSRFGFAVPVGGQTIITTSVDNIGNGASMYQEIESHGTFTLGVAAALGYSFSISDKLSIFGEVQYQGMSVISGTSEITTYNIGGQSMLSLMDTYDIETEYVETLNTSSNNKNYNPSGVDKDSAKEEIAGTSPFSSCGFNIGIVYKF